MLHGEILFSILNPRFENGGFVGSPNQNYGKHLGGIWARHSRNKRATRQANQID